MAVNKMNVGGIRMNSCACLRGGHLW